MASAQDGTASADGRFPAPTLPGAQPVIKTSMRISKSVLILLAGAALAPLAACKVDNRPLLARMDGEPQPASYAALPQPGDPYDAAPEAPAYPPGYATGAYAAGTYAPERRIAYAPDRAWPYAEQAWGLDQAFYDVPPDYGFAYGDEEPWAWEAADDSLMFAEPYGDAYRFYYYEPGAAYPYFVQDPYYGYAYGSDGALIALYTAAGALLSADSYGSYWPQASQYWSRGYDLHRAYGGGQRYEIAPQVWAQRAPALARVQQTWVRAGAEQPAWRDWRARTGQDFAQRYAPDRDRHMQAARQRFAAAGPMPGDNGRHLGWTQGRHEGWANGGGPPQVTGRAGPAEAPGRMRMAEARMPRFERPAQPGMGAPRGPEHRGEGRQADARARFAARGPEGGAPEFRAQTPSAFQGGGFHGDRGHGGWHGGGAPQAFAHQEPRPQPAPHPEPRFAQAAPQPGGGWHGGGQPHAAPQPQPAPQPQQGGHPGGGGHGQGQGQAQGGGHGNGNDKHGHGG